MVSPMKHRRGAPYRKQSSEVHTGFEWFKRGLLWTRVIICTLDRSPIYLTHPCLQRMGGGIRINAEESNGSTKLLERKSWPVSEMRVAETVARKSRITGE